MTTKRKCLFAVVVLSAAAAVLFHATLLRQCAAPLLVDEPAEHFQCVGIFDIGNAPDGDRCFDVAATLARQCSGGVVVLESAPTRLIEVGAVPSFEAISRRELQKRGLAENVIHVIHRDGDDVWSMVRAIQVWLAEHPKDTMVLLGSRFRGAYLRRAIDRTIKPDQAARVRIYGLTDRRYNENDWWKSRAGLKEFGFFWLRQLHAWCVNGDHQPLPYCNADDYERHFLASPSSSTGCWLDVGRPPKAADYALLLGGGENTRPFVMAALYKAGFVQKIMVAEDAALPQNVDAILPPYHEINRNVLVKRGVPSADFAFLPATAESTYDEALALAAFLKDKPEARVLIVTDDYHSRRSRWVFDRALGRQADRVTFVSAPSIDSSPGGWWRDEASFVAIAIEFPKFAFYVFDYGYFGDWLLACGGLALVSVWIRNHSYRSASIGSNRDAFHAG
jgi:uncharacterized SAM-binding protein YcdF (DUF218 family)